jgi:hypothetical protein
MLGLLLPARLLLLLLLLSGMLVLVLASNTAIAPCCPAAGLPTVTSCCLFVFLHVHRVTAWV